MSSLVKPAGSPAAATWIVVPAYNEAGRLAQVLDALAARWPNIVVVDDGSTDDTRAVCLGRPVWCVRHTMNLGQGAAIQTGLDFALGRGAEYVVTFDADGQHLAEDVPRLLETLRSEDADFALGSRFLGAAIDIPSSRRLLLRLAVLFTRLTSGVRVTDAHNGLRAMTRRGAASIRIRMNRMEHASEILDQIRDSSLKYVEVPVSILYTADSLAKGQRSRAAFRLALKLFLERVLR